MESTCKCNVPRSLCSLRKEESALLVKNISLCPSLPFTNLKTKLYRSILRDHTLHISLHISVRSHTKSKHATATIQMIANDAIIEP